MAKTFTSGELAGYLDEALPVELMSEIENELRQNDELKRALAQVIGRRDAGVHSLGDIWRNHRLTCPTRDDWGSFLMGVLPPEQETYYNFHLHPFGCRLCQANVADLQDRHSRASSVEATARKQRYFQSSVGHIPKLG